MSCIRQGGDSGMDYYSILDVPRSAELAEIRLGYRKAALRCHPDKDASPGATRWFAFAAEAYEVLSHGKRRAEYDAAECSCSSALRENNEETLREQFHFDPITGPAQTFRRVFGVDSYFEALHDLAHAVEAHAGAVPTSSGHPSMHIVPVTLEEVQSGLSKRVEFVRKTCLSATTCEEEHVVVNLDIKPGMLDETQFRFDGRGDVLLPGAPPEAAVLVLLTANHPRFARRGHDLLHTATTPLAHALAGGGLTIPTLDGRILNIPLAQVVTEGHEIVLPGEGLPKLEGGKGDLIVTVHVLFPAELTEIQRELVKAALYFPVHPAAGHENAAAAFTTAFCHPLHGWSTGYPNS